MTVGLIDVDSHNFPNLALMKLSAWHKAQGDTVEWWSGFGEYDLVYMSKVFDETYSPDALEPVNAIRIKDIHFAWDYMKESKAVLRGLRPYREQASRKVHGDWGDGLRLDEPWHHDGRKPIQG